MVDDSAWISFVQSANRAELDEIFRYQTNYKLLVPWRRRVLYKRGYALWIKSEIMALRLLIGKRTFRLAQALVIIVHYAVLAITALFWTLLWAKSVPCQAVLWSIWTIYVAVWAMSNGRREQAFLMQREKSTAVPNFHAKVAPPHLQAHHLPHCRLERLPYEAAYAWTLSFFFDFSVVVAIWLAYRGNEVFAPFPPDHHLAHLNYDDEDQHEDDGVVVSHRGNSRERLPSARGWLYKSNTNYFKYTAFWSIVCACWAISMSDEWLSHLIAPVAIVMHGLSTKKIVLSVHLDSFALKFRRQRDGEESNDEDIEGEHERGARLHLRRARRQAREAALRQHQDRIGIDDDYFDSSDDDFERERGPRLFQKWNRLKRQVKTVFDDTFMPTSWQHEGRMPA
ncbi:hypothetical protein FA10DRAFT_290762 [Acaromyces ingoldii]|uniref:Uncharacterized protein n=1 Tax=Acaromyces ingoldii TaxID=215250 RepID=A0A316YWQ6_9BASI|nr:hypothetical protein FA10DRAFT_290762 [Acaromyces ingoldii]PWN93562.1 hypothetical protein FA10DRAFT_290762 [Acaromyces ingoldii]